MAWQSLSSTTTLPSSTVSSTQDMKMYELTEHLRSMQIVQAEQSRRLDEQSWRLHQLEMKELQTNRFESQRYLWGPGAVGTSQTQTPPATKGLTGLGFEVFSPVAKEKEMDEHQLPQLNERSENTIEADIDHLLFSPTSTTTKENTIPESTSTVEEVLSRAGSQSPAIPPNVVNYFPYVLGVQCWIGGRTDRPSPTEQDILTAQINTSVHASFIDSALIHHLGLSHRIRNRRHPPRYNNNNRHQSTPRPRILLPVYFPVDPTISPSSSSESQVSKIQIDFVVVSTHEFDSQRLAPLEIGTQALFLHGIDVLFSSRSMKIAGLNIPLAQVAPRDQKRLLSSIVLAPLVSQQPSWDRIQRRNTKPDESNETWTNVEEPTLLRDPSTNSSFSSTSATTFQSTALTSPVLTDGMDSMVMGKEDGLPTPPPTAGAFTSALQFIPSSVVARPAVKSEERTVDDKLKTIPLDRSTSSQSEQSHLKDDIIEHPPTNTERIEYTEPSTIEISKLEDSLPSPSPSRKSSFAVLPADQIPSRKSSLIMDDDSAAGPRLPSHLLDSTVKLPTRKSSSTWPRSLGKKVAPWTSQDATKTSILGTSFGESDSPVVVPARRMKVLKPVRKVGEVDYSMPDGLKVDVRDVVRVEVAREGEDHKGQQQVGKNVGGGAFHWMK